MLPTKKKGGGILELIASAPKGGESDEGKADDMEPSSGGAEKMAAEALISAVKSGDASAVASAFRRLKDCCDMGGDEESGEADESDAAYGE